MIAGILTPTPKAIDSPADPAVCTMLFSRIVASRMPALPSRRKRLMEITATGMEALTVSPTFNTSHSDDAPNTIPSNVPTINGSNVNSRTCTLAGIYGLKVARSGFTSDLAAFTPATSGNSFAPTLSEDIRFGPPTDFLKRGRARGYIRRRLLYTGGPAAASGC